jgi:hypothetical protein
MKLARRLCLGLLCALSGVLAVAAPSAGADIQVFQSSFNGAGSTAGPFTPYAIGPIGIDQATGTVYVRDRGPGGSYGGGSYPGFLHRFDLDGNPTKYPGTNTTSLPMPVGYFGGPGYNPDRLAIDNSGTATQGNIYINTEQLGTYGFDSSGNPLSSNFPVFQFEYCGVTVAPDGSIWVNEFFGMTQYTAAGTATGVKVPADGCHAAFDADGNAYVYSLFNALIKYDGANDLASLGGIGDTGAVSAIAVDPTTKDVWVAHKNVVYGYRYSDPLVPSAPFEPLTGFQASDGIAFDGDGNLYVAETGVPGDPASTKVNIFRRQPESAPIVKRQSASKVRSTSAYVNAQVVAAGSDTSVYFEYGTDSSYGTVLPEIDLGNQATPFTPSAAIEGLAPGTTYHYRVVATNEEGTTEGPDRSFTTFPTPPGGSDPCPNALVRQQTGSRALLDCRAYELVSARNTGGSDVESSLVPGQTPYGGYPDAEDRVLYALHAGVLPDAGDATNRGPDPYLATRGVGGWSTRYVGIPANINDVSGPFSSTLAEASADLDSFAFGGDELCAPCFTDGIETGIPVRLPDGTLAQGMAGSLDPGPGAEPEGHVAKHLSADGTHLIFGSSSRFEPDGNTGGDISIYDRDLVTGTTRVVSKTPAGTTMSGPGIAELDISADGSRVIVAQKASEDANGNGYWHPYMTIAGSDRSVDLAPGAGDGVLYDGMTDDGSRVFFTSNESLLGADGDASADIYAADVDDAGNVTPSLVTPTGGDPCDPVPNSDGDHWNAVGAGANCDAVAIAGGGGVATGSGTIYFLSPELLDGVDGRPDEPNLYLAAPDAPPRFVATLEPDNQVVRNALLAAEERKTADFQVTPSGDDAVFVSQLALTGVDTGGDGEIYRYHAPDPAQIDCASCDPTGGESPGTGGDALLARDGLSLTDDGRVFFTTPGALVLNDSNNRLDVYEWAEGAPQLISSGMNQFDSGLLGVSADGTDAFFFTHEALAAAEDENQTLTRIYDARSGGGFFAIPSPPPCKASDECHGAGTTAPGPPSIRSAVAGNLGNVESRPAARCKKHQVKKRGKCVAKKKKKAKKKRKKKRDRSGGRNHG